MDVVKKTASLFFVGCLDLMIMDLFALFNVLDYFCVTLLDSLYYFSFQTLGVITRPVFLS